MQQPSIERVEQMLREALTCDQASEVARLVAQLDELEARQRRSVPLGSAALWYAEQGLRVFPVQPGLKIPYPRTRGVLEASSDVTLVRRWWSARPDSNIGIATGHIVDVIDIDGFRGNVALCRLLDDAPDALDHCVGKVSTPRAGGRHLYVPAAGYGNGAALADSIDYRGKGGYVLAPPSRTEQGLYSWTAALDVDGARSRCVA